MLRSSLVFPVEFFFLVLVGNPKFAAGAFTGEGLIPVSDFEDTAALDAASFGDLGAVERGSEGGKSIFGTFQKTHEEVLLAKVVRCFYWQSLNGLFDFVGGTVQFDLFLMQFNHILPFSAYVAEDS
jgi:hypothetical protein